MNNNDSVNPGCGAVLVTFIGVMVFAVLATVAAIAVVTLPFMWAWGAFMAPVFGLPLLSFSQAFAAVLMLGIVSVLFKTSVRRYGKD